MYGWVQYSRLQFNQRTHGFFNWRLGIHAMRVVQVNIIGTEQSQALRTSLLAIRSRAVNGREAWGALYESKFGREEDLVPFPGPLEPLSQKLFIVAVHTDQVRGLANHMARERDGYCLLGTIPGGGT